MTNEREEADLSSQANRNQRKRRNVTIGGRRTSVSLEGHVWEGLLDVCRREAIGIDTLCTEVDRRRVRSSMSSSLRVFLLLYFRSMADGVDRRPADGDGAGTLDAALSMLRASEQAGGVGQQAATS